MDKPIRVLHVIGIMNRGGAETMIMNLYRHIDRSKVQFDFVENSSEPAIFDEEIISLGGRIYRCPHYNGKNHFTYVKWWNEFFQAHSKEYPIVRQDLSRYVFVKKCAIRIDKKQKERYGKKYCHHSPSIEESLLQDAVMRAIMQTAKQNVEVLKTLKIHIGMGLTDEVTEDKTLDIQIRIAEINTEFQKLLKAVSADNADGIDEERITELMNEKQRLTVQLEQYAAMRQKRESAKSRLDEIYTILDGLQNHPMEYNDKLVRQIIECIVVESKEKIKVVFIGGTEIEMTL